MVYYHISCRRRRKPLRLFFPLNHDYRPVSEFRCYGTKVLSRQNTTPSLEDLEYNETCVPRLSDQDIVLIVIAISQVIISALADDDLHI